MLPACSAADGNPPDGGAKTVPYPTGVVAPRLPNPLKSILPTMLPNAAACCPAIPALAAAACDDNAPCPIRILPLCTSLAEPNVIACPGSVTCGPRGLDKNAVVNASSGVVANKNLDGST